MNKRKFIVEIQEIFVFGSVTYNGRRKLGPAVNRIVQGKGESPLADILLNGMDIIDSKNASKVIDNSIEQRNIFVCKELLRTARGNLFASHQNCIQSHNRISLRLIIVGKFLNVFLYDFGIFFGRTSELQNGLFIFRSNLRIQSFVIYVIGIIDKVKISEFFPFSIFICHLGIIDLMAVNRIHGKNQVSVHQRINHHHDDYRCATGG